MSGPEKGQQPGKMKPLQVYAAIKLNTLEGNISE